jgi:hypothetical protein
MAMPEITENDVIQSVTVVVDAAKKRLGTDEELLHQRGYHSYSTAVANFRSAVDREFSIFVDKLIDAGEGH